MIRNKELPCGHIKHIKIRSKNWIPWCIECQKKVSPIRRYPIREQIKGEYLESLASLRTKEMERGMMG